MSTSIMYCSVYGVEYICFNHVLLCVPRQVCLLRLCAAPVMELSISIIYPALLIELNMRSSLMCCSFIELSMSASIMSYSVCQAECVYFDHVLLVCASLFLYLRFNPFLPGNPGKVHWKIVKTQIRRHMMWHLIRVYIVC